MVPNELGHSCTGCSDPNAEDTHSELIVYIVHCHCHVSCCCQLANDLLSHCTMYLLGACAPPSGGNDYQYVASYFDGLGQDVPLQRAVHIMFVTDVHYYVLDNLFNEGHKLKLICKCERCHQSCSCKVVSALSVITAPRADLMATCDDDDDDENDDERATAC